MPYRSPRDPFHHQNIVDSKIVSVASILPRLSCSLYHQCIVAQQALITNLIGEYNATKEVGCILAVRPNRVWYKNLEELLNKEEVIYKIIIDWVNKYEYTCSPRSKSLSLNIE
jgi:(2Fe-2S) ferredoxin